MKYYQMCWSVRGANNLARSTKKDEKERPYVDTYLFIYG